MSESRSPRPTLPGRVTAVRAAVESALKLVAAAALSVAWMVFWGNVVRIHYGQGDVVAATFTAVTLVGPGLVALAWLSLRALDRVDVSPPTGSLPVGTDGGE